MSLMMSAMATMMLQRPSDLKECFKCGAEKPRTDFYANPQMKDGLLGKCKECAKEDERARRFNPKFREAILKYDRGRKERRGKKNRTVNQLRAHNAVIRAKVNGKIVKKDNCENCDSDFAVVAHHDDYLKPLEVRWLCQACHMQWHSANGEGKNKF
jgi:hypothetical protein